MSTRLVGWALRDVPNDYPELTLGARFLLVYLADHLNEDEGAAWPSQTRLARLMSCSERSIRNYLEELVDAGLIAKTFRTGTSSLYRFTIARQILPESPNKPRQTLPVGKAKPAAQSGKACRQTSKEPINEPEPEPMTDEDRERIAAMVSDLRARWRLEHA